MSKLFSDDEGSVNNDEVQLTINEHYAKAFEYRKEREELDKLKAKYGSDYDPDASDSEFSTDSESAESEDEHGEELTPAVDAAILRTLARIRKRDPAIYDSNKNIFGEEKEKVSSKPIVALNSITKTKGKSKPVTIRQANLDAMLHGSRSVSPEDDDHRPLTHVEEQERLRKETIAAFNKAVPEGEEDEFLIPREKTKDEIEREEEEYRAFLEREVGDLRELVSVDGLSEEEIVQEQEVKEDEGSADEAAEESGKKKKKKKKGKATPEAGPSDTSNRKKTKAEEDQEFLMSYILNRGWIDHSENHVPTYNEITTTSTTKNRKNKGKAKADPSDGLPNDVEEDMDTGLLSGTSFESLASHFEASYNHRYEEPGAATIPAFPRNITSAVRRPDTTRKDARERKKARKEEEMEKKREEVRRLKALKMREVKRKLEMIGRQGGLLRKGAKGEEEDEFVDEALRELDLEGEWDPEKHDRQMMGLFDRGADAFEDDLGAGGEVYGGDEGIKYDADGKPHWDDDIDIGDILISGDEPMSMKAKPKRKEKKKKKKGGEEEDAGVDIDAMDADVERQSDDEEEWDGTGEVRKRKLNEYMDEIYGLEFNDMVGDLPTRFKYTKVQSTNYSLTPAEILMATDKELNEYMSVKKYAPYRKDNPDKHRWNKNNQEKLRELKSKVTERGGGAFGLGDASGAGEEKTKKRKGKKERMKAKAAPGTQDGEKVDAAFGDDVSALSAAAPQSIEDEGKKSKKRKRDRDTDKIGSKGSERAAVGGDVDLNGDEDISKKKKKRRHKKKEDGVA